MLLLTVFIYILFKLIFVSEPYVLITEDGFYPKVLNAEVNETIVFRNIGNDNHWPASNEHPIHTEYPSFDTKRPLKQGEEWRYAFSEEGKWAYHDHLFPENLGVIQVDGIGRFKLLERIKSRLEQSFQGAIALYRNLALSGSTNVKSIEEIASIEDLNKKYEDINFSCKDADIKCISQFLETFNSEYGPNNTLIILDRLVGDGRINKNLDIHQFSHIIGRNTAEVFGVNPESFYLCPMTVLGEGCLHGYFEYVLSTSGSLEATTAQICDSLQGKYPGKILFSCFHGLGHGIMMANTYTIEDSLLKCDELPYQQAREGCYQGVFMESIQAYFKGFARPEYYLGTDPMHLCKQLDNKYQKECYLNYGAYLLDFTKSFEESSKLCLSAGSSQNQCARGLGTYTIEQSWLNKVGISSDYEQTVSKSIQICNNFPETLIIDCFEGAMSNLFNRDYPLIENRIVDYCSQISGWGKEVCYREIGININNSTNKQDEKIDLCNKIPSSYRIYCLEGANINL